MKIKQKTIDSHGVRLSIDINNKEVARTYLYIMHNNLHKEPFGLLEDVFVDENFRGQGLGIKIINKAIREAKKNKCYKLIATSRHSRPKVHELYKKLGFKEQGIEFRIDF